MNFLDLEYFVIIAEELNFTKAAKRLFISQQALSSHIAKLEAHLGMELFDRKPPLTLTNAGLCLLHYAHDILSIKEQAMHELQDIKDFKSAELAIGVTYSRGTVILPVILPVFRQQYPNIKIHLFEAETSAILLDALNKGTIELAIGFSFNDPYNITSEFLCEEQTVVVAPKKVLEEHFKERKDQILLQLRENPSIELLKNCPFITMPATTWLGNVFLSCCREKGIKPLSVLETHNIATSISLCMQGMGIIVCPQIHLYQYKHLYNPQFMNDVVVFPLDYMSVEKIIAVSYLKNKYLSLASREFIRVTKELMECFKL